VSIIFPSSNSCESKDTTDTAHTAANLMQSHAPGTRSALALACDLAMGLGLIVWALAWIAWSLAQVVLGG